MLLNLLERIESKLVPIEFGLLFSLMLFYWGQMAFFSYTKYKKLNHFIFFLCFFSLTSILGLRWINSGHFPLSNLYESLLFLSWSCLFSQFIFQWTWNIKNRTTNINSATFSKNQTDFSEKSSRQQLRGNYQITNSTNSYSIQDLLNVVISPLALVSYGFAFLNLPKEMQKATSLVPALQSHWLMMHVTVMILSYAALLCGSILSMAFLLVNFLSTDSSPSLPASQVQTTLTDIGLTCVASSAENKKYIQPIHANQTGFDSSVKGINSRFLNSQESLCELLDNLSYRILGLGFPLLTIGILSGAVWANSAWGSYWSWDPKETWALITWLIFAIYLHARISKGWSGQKPAIIATAGFFVIWFCYLGVNLIGTGLHSYGWFK